MAATTEIRLTYEHMGNMYKHHLLICLTYLHPINILIFLDFSKRNYRRSTHGVNKVLFMRCRFILCTKHSTGLFLNASWLKQLSDSKSTNLLPQIRYLSLSRELCWWITDNFINPVVSVLAMALFMRSIYCWNIQFLNNFYY